MTPRRKLRGTTPKWDVPVCPDPEYCNTLRNTLGESCASLSKAMTEPELYEQITGEPKAKFHAASNPYMSTSMRRIAVGLEDIAVYKGLLLNPSLTREDLGKPAYWGSRILFLKTFLPRHDLIPASSLLELATLKNASSYGTWKAMLDSRNLPRDAYRILLEGENSKLIRRVVQHERAPAYFLVECLKYPTDEFYEAVWGDERHPAICHPNLPVDALMTAVACDELMEVHIVQEAEARSHEVREWLAANQPDLMNVPIEWARLVLTGASDE